MADQWTLKTKLTLSFVSILVIASALLGFAAKNDNKLMETVGWNTHLQSDG